MTVKMYRWLKIKNVRKDDAGLYTCVVMNKCDEKSSVSMHLHVRRRKYLIIVITKWTILCRLVWGKYRYLYSGIFTQTLN